MKINDRVYGKIVINEPILIKLIHSKPLQRLKRINQAGASQYALKGKTVTRYEHSLGVMILLKKLNAPLEEQIAGLLHDIPHTAFSHVIDFVFKDKNNAHEFHEKFHKRIMLKSEIPAILKKYGFDINRIIDEHKFQLLERKIPDICADRIDYTLRDMVATEGFIKKINTYISSFIIYKNVIIIKNRSIAKMFAEDYMRMDKKDWSNPLTIALYQTLADAIRIAIDEKIIIEDDLFGDDSSLYKKLKESKNQFILNKLKMLNHHLRIIDDPSDFTFYSKTKLRYINPKFFNPDNSISRVTSTFKEFSDKIKKHKERIKRGNFIKIVSY